MRRSSPAASAPAAACERWPKPPGPRPHRPEPPRPADLLLDGLVTTFTQGYAAGVPGLRRALEAFARHERDAHAVNDSDNRRWLWLASRTAMSALRRRDWSYALAARHVRLAREAGALATLPAALLVQSVMLVLTGEFARAAELTAEAAAITRATGARRSHAQLILAAWRGRSDETTELHATIVREAAGRGRGTEVALAQYALAVLHNGLGDYPAALAAATRACESDELTHSNLALPELIEAAVRAGQPERATAALDQLSSRARASGTPWALGLAARSRALTSTGPAAEEHYREAIERLRAAAGWPPTSPAPTSSTASGCAARAAARTPASSSAPPTRCCRTWARRRSPRAPPASCAPPASTRANGPPSRPTRSPPRSCTIARLVATGATSREVGAQLFLSPRTIEAHLRSIFRKLGITSRRQLRDLQLP